MATELIPLQANNNALRVGVDLPSITTTTKTEFIGFDGKFIRSTVDAYGKPHRIHKVITTTTTVTCFGDEDIASKNDQTAEEKFVEHVKELGADTKDVLLHTASNVQHALETASGFIRTQLSTSSTTENTTKTNEKDQTNLLQQATAFKDVLVQKALDVKEATVEAFKDITAPEESTTTTTVVAEKKQS